MSEQSGATTAPPSSSVADLVRHSYERFSGSPALFVDGSWLTFAELECKAASIARSLAELGAGVGDRVVIALHNRPEVVAIEHALFLTNRVRVALSARLHPREVAAIARDCDARVLICESSHATAIRADDGLLPEAVAIVTAVPTAGAAASLDELASRSAGGIEPTQARADSVVALMYTSGTTGQPKGAIVTNRAWTAMLDAVWAELPPIGPGDVVLHAAPMSHFSGSLGYAYTLRGAATTTLGRFRVDETLETIERSRVSAVPLVPTMLKDLTVAAESGRYDLSSLRAIPYGGAAIAPTALARAQRAFGDVLYQFYGLSEALIPLTALSAADHRHAPSGPVPDRLSSAGRITPHVDLRIVDGGGQPVATGEIGEIRVRGDVVTPGYWNQPNQSAESFGDGWFRTGDLGLLDQAGYVHILDRSKDVIVTGGFTVYATEVEQVIEALDAVAEVVVVGVPSERWGEGIVAVVVRRPGHEIGSEEVIEVCEARLAAYKRPVKVEFVDMLPRTSTGKISRREVRDRFWQGRPRNVGE